MSEDRLAPWQPGAVLIGRGTSSASQLLTGLAAIKANAALAKMIGRGGCPWNLYDFTNGGFTGGPQTTGNWVRNRFLRGPEK